VPDRQVAVCRELTKRFEEVAVGTPGALVERFAEPPRGEITLVLGAPAGGVGVERGLEDARAAVTELVDAGTPRRTAAEVVARLTDTSRNDLYRSTL
jgi:16S rRNA (cytidine1402-2'-O)-methyltransferase